MSAPRQRPALPTSGLPLGRVLGVPVLISPSWLIVVAFITIGYAPIAENRVGGLGSAAYAVSFAFAVLLGASVLVHELGHCLVSLAFGLPVRRLTLFLLGGVTEIEGEPQTPRREALVAGVGPVVSLLIAGAAYLAGLALDGATVAGLLASWLALANLLLGGFNLLPGLPLDGGRVLRAAVWRITGDGVRGLSIAGWGGRLVAVGVAVAAVALARPTSATDVLFPLLVAAFIWVGATQAVRRAAVQRRLPALSVAQLVRPAIGVAGDVPVAEAVRQAQERGARGLVVVDAAGRPVAVVEEAAVAALPEQRRPWVPVSSVARSLGGRTLALSLPGAALIEQLQENPASEYVVVDDTGAVVGVLATADVARGLDPRAGGTRATAPASGV